MTSRQLVAVVDDEPDILELVAVNLRRAGFEVAGYGRSSDFLDSLEEGKVPDIVILDLMLPDIHGTEVCRRIRSSGNVGGLPIIMLSAMAEESDRVAGLEMGADDYVTKPFSPRELVARVKAILRRGDPGEEVSGVVRAGDSLLIDPDRFRVKLEGNELDLTSTEFRLLLALVEGRGRVLSRKRLLDILWQGEKFVTERTIDVHIAHLRRKLGASGELIENVRGIGYRFAESS